MDYDAFFDKHPQTILAFSAGKDSAACLWQLQPYWHRLTVVWVNQGDPYSETLEYMEKIRKLVPQFKMLLGDQPTFVRKHGWPADALALQTTPLGALFTNYQGTKFIPFLACCGANLWDVISGFIHEQKITGVIRGQKDMDAKKSSIQGPGGIAGGIEYLHPLWNWSDEQVGTFLGDRIPPSYTRGLTSSLDCQSCTAYLAENGARLKEMEQTNPKLRAQIRSLHKELAASLNVAQHELAGVL